MSEGGLRGLFRENFLEYASYVIKDRAIPEADDGLKPVQRRILWSLRELDDGRFNKVANVIGHCMRYHPHGDASIGDALVSLANRGYFIDRQGNFGNDITGDAASAPRYIEARLTDLARETLFDDRVTEFTDSYDGRNREPVALPARIPVLLLLGAEGIAVGMSTRILPHNFNEVLQAMISCIRGKPFSLMPDFPQGGSIDPSGYEDGAGRIRNRATIERRRGQKKLVIREIPWGATVESLISSIEAAARKGRVKVSSIDDFTSREVEIELTLSRGAEPDETMAQLYAHTDCEMTYTSNIVVIRGGRPAEMKVSELLRHSAERLLDISRRQLGLDLAELEAKLRWMTLEQIFIENRVYKRIEEQTSEDGVAAAVEAGMAPHLGGLELTPDDVEKLLSIRIRRISRFDIDRHRAEMGEIAAAAEAIRRKLSDVGGYAVSWLQGVMKRFGRLHPRLTRIETFDEIDVKQVSLRNLKVGFDRKGGFVGTAVRGEVAFDASEYDRIVVLTGAGVFRILPVAEKHFVDGDVVHCGLHDKSATFTAVYRLMDTRVAWMKRFRIESFILEKEYRFLPENAELLVFSCEEAGTVEFWFERRKRMKVRKGEQRIEDVHVMGSGARGHRLGGGRPVSSARMLERRPDAVPAAEAAPETPATAPDPAPEPDSGEEAREAPEDPGPDGASASEEPGASPRPSWDQLLTDLDTLRRKSSEAVRRAGGDTQPDLFGED